MFDNFSKELNELLIGLGFNPIYFTTVILILMCFYYLKHIRNWENLIETTQHLIIVLYLSTSLMIVISITSLFIW